MINMHKRNGFTLIELMSVIVIMAIVILIAVPAYSNISQSIREKNYDQKKDLIEIQAEKFIVDKSIVSNYEEFDITVGTLLQFGYLDYDDSDKEDIYDIDGNSIACNIIKINVSSGSPKAEFTNKNNCNLNTQTYVDSIIQLTAYELNEGVANNAIGYASSNNNNSIVLDRRLKWVNSDILLMLSIPEGSKFSENNIKTVTWNVVNDNHVYDNQVWLTNKNDYVKDLEYKNVYKIDNTKKIQNDTKYRVSVTLEYLDNNVTKVETLSTYIIIRIDKQAPTVSAITDDNWGAKEKSIFITGSDKEGSGISHFCINDSNNYDGCERVDLNSNSLNSATVKHYKGQYFIWAIDNAGNVSTEPAVVLVENIDNTPPTCTWSGEKTMWSKAPVTITIKCNDSESGCVEQEYVRKFTGGSTKTKFISFAVKDKAGNEAICEKEANIYIDVVPPACTVTGAAASTDPTWARERTIKVVCNDTGSGPAETTYSIVYGVNATSESRKNVKTSSISNYKSTDNLGNYTYYDFGYNVYVDTYPPTCTAQGNSTWTYAPVAVNLKCSDTLSGCTRSAFSKTFSASTDTASVSYLFSDNAGNTYSCVRTVNVKLDTQKYGCSITPNGTMGNNGIYTSYTGYSYSVSNNVMSLTYTPSCSVSNITNGKRISCEMTMASAKKASCSKDIKLDTEDPTIGITNNGDTTNIKFTDNYGLAGYYISKTNSTPTTWNSISGTSKSIDYNPPTGLTYYVFVKDVSGRVSNKSFQNTNVCAYNTGTAWAFNYKGSIQEFTVPCTGYYYLEVYGAQGGTSNGGLGGYAAGTKHLTKGQKIYIGTGGNLKDGSPYNGGGRGGESGNNRGAGGGATHMALDNNYGELKYYENFKDSVLIVAGGGGGGTVNEGNSNTSAQGGAGGNLVGGTGGYTGCYYGDSRSNCFQTLAGGGGEYSGGEAGVGHTSDGSTFKGEAGSFGQGGNGNPWQPGGGGGWYGGGSAGVIDSHTAGGGGGSSYVKGVTDSAMQSGINSGAGHATITFSKY